MFSCPIKKNFGIECLGCGLQRSFVLLLKGEWQQSVVLYPGLIPMLGMFAFLLIHLKFRFKNGPPLLVTMFILTSIIILTNFIYKLTISH